MSFHITIKNNKTSEIICDEEIIGICGAIQKVDTNTGELIFTDCNALELAALLQGAQEVLRTAKQKSPLSAMIAAMTLAASEADATSDTEDE